MAEERHHTMIWRHSSALWSERGATKLAPGMQGHSVFKIATAAGRCTANKCQYTREVGAQSGDA